MLREMQVGSTPCIAEWAEETGSNPAHLLVEPGGGQQWVRTMPKGMPED